MYIMSSNLGKMPGSRSHHTSDPYTVIQHIRDDIEENAEYGLSDIDYITYWMKHGLFNTFYDALSNALKSDFGIECYRATEKKIGYILLDNADDFTYAETYDSIFNLKTDYAWLLVRTQDLDSRGLVGVEAKHIRAKCRTSYEDHGKKRRSKDRWSDVVEDGSSRIYNRIDSGEFVRYLEDSISFDGTLKSYMTLIREEVAYKRAHPYEFFYGFTNPQGMNLDFNIVSKQDFASMINSELQFIQLDVSNVGEYIEVLSDDGSDVVSYVPVKFKMITSKFLFDVLKYSNTRTVMNTFEDQLIREYVDR